MTYSEALAFIHRTDWKGSRLGLERIRELLHRLGDPQKRLSFVHVAGTNGKGSVSCMLASVLTAAGYRTGLFTSPFLVEFRERICIDLEMITEAELVECVGEICSHVEAMQDAPTEFELMTALAFWYFAKKGCDVVVCEVGLGGELDSTNVIEKPLLSVITSIGLDHVRELGDSIRQIARAKAGILKHGAPALFAEPENRAAEEEIRRRADLLGVCLETVDQSRLAVTKSDLTGTEFSVSGHGSLCIRLLGSYQPRNALTVVSACEILVREGLRIPEDALQSGLLSARWPGRFEALSLSPAVILDGAHNLHGALALRASLSRYFGEEGRVVALCAVMADKDYGALFSALQGAVQSLYAVTPAGHERALDAKKLAAVCGELFPSAVACDSVADGARAALSEAQRCGLPLVVFGSLYLYREAAAALSALLDQSGTQTERPSAKE